MENEMPMSHKCAEGLQFHPSKCCAVIAVLRPKRVKTYLKEDTAGQTVVVPNLDFIYVETFICSSVFFLKHDVQNPLPCPIQKRNRGRMDLVSRSEKNKKKVRQQANPTQGRRSRSQHLYRPTHKYTHLSWAHTSKDHQRNFTRLQVTDVAHKFKSMKTFEIIFCE